jgi:hypothetical protein
MNTGTSPGYETWSYSSTGVASPTVVANTLLAGKPIAVRADPVPAPDQPAIGHAWVIDGYGYMDFYREFLRDNQTGTTGYVLITTNNSLMVHCNFGWDGISDGWYIYGLFDTGHTPLLSGNNQGSGLDFSLNIKMAIPVPN